MSCTENESGPFVVFFLPAVVGCLTILLARRWANSQVSNTSSTAVSRRRKIIKDPLVKRPLPPIACKMVPPGTKKAPGMIKKGSFTVLEDDININGKRLYRPSRPLAPMSNGVGLTEYKMPEGPVGPKHIPFPYIPQDGELTFEVIMFMFTLAATGLQFLNLYRTAWWLPHSYTTQAMNFHLIDPHLVAFIITLLFRRLLLGLSLALLKTVLVPKMIPHAAAAAKLFIFGVILGVLVWCAYFTALKYPLVKLFYLCYPALVYFLLFGFQLSPFLELTNQEAPPLHCCSHEPQQIRAEVEALRQDFNLRVKKILFNSVIGAYYSSFIPCCFAQWYVYYDVYGASQQVAFVWGGVFGGWSARLLCATYCDVSHRAALHLGKWRRDNTPCFDINSLEEWNGDKLYPAGSRVSHRGRAYLCESRAASEPGAEPHHRFQAVFSNPSILLCLLLCLQLSLIVLQLCLLFSSMSWHHFLSIVILLFINYYNLFQLFRDYLVAWKVYKAENMIQDRNGSLPSTVH